MVLMVRSSGDPLELVQPLKDIVRTFDANLPMLRTSSYMELYLNQAVRGPRIAMDMLAAMGAVGSFWPSPVCMDWWRTTSAAEPGRSAYAWRLAPQAQTCCA